MKNHVNALIVAGVIITSTGCTAQTGITENDLIGNWIEIMPVNVQFTQGVTLQKEGVASSIGMATLKYESWELKDGKSLILNGQSIGNRQTISFSDTLSVISLQNDTLTLGKGDKYRIQYTRQTDAPQPIGGSDAAMGYTYSNVLKKKIRIFEEGIRVLSTTDPEATQAGYIVFGPDSAEAELFLPENKVLLQKRQRPNGTKVWNMEDDDTYMVEQSEGSWLVSRRGQLLYSTHGTTDALPVTFTTDNGETIETVFYQKSAAAQLTVNGVRTLLIQYRTASGYGYANPLYDLRGKGDEAQLTCLSDGKTINLKEKKDK